MPKKVVEIAFEDRVFSVEHVLALLVGAR